MEEIYVNLVVIPLLIFLSKVADVSLGTIRIIFVNKGHKILAPILGFFEVLVWIIAISKLMENLTNFWLYIVYALGFSIGTYVGIYLDEKLSYGKVMMRVVVKRNDKKLLENLRDQGYPLTIAPGESGLERQKVSIVLSVINRKRVPNFLEIVNKTNPRAFYSIEDMRRVRDFDHISSIPRRGFRFNRKRK